jgi:hypothetical protein
MRLKDFASVEACNYIFARLISDPATRFSYPRIVGVRP